MKKKNIIMGILVLALYPLSVGFVNDALMKDFVSFDRAFIPPLALTNAEKLNPSKEAMGLLKENWDSFKAKQYNANPNDPKWKSDLDKVDQKIFEAAAIVRTEKNLSEAHEILEQIRFIFMELRKRNGIEYYIDYLSDFHEHMEAIMHTVQERDPASFSAKDKDYVAREFDQADKTWKRIETAAFDKDFYGFSDQRLARMKECLKLETEALNNLKKALEGEDKALIIKAAKGIRPNYAEIYKLFGDFERVAAH